MGHARSLTYGAHGATLPRSQAAGAYFGPQKARYTGVRQSGTSALCLSSAA